LETAAQYVALGDLFQEQTERAQAALNKAALKRKSEKSDHPSFSWASLLSWPQ
jgi:hypothetical protein